MGDDIQISGFVKRLPGGVIVRREKNGDYLLEKGGEVIGSVPSTERPTAEQWKKYARDAWKVYQRSNIFPTSEVGLRLGGLSV